MKTLRPLFAFALLVGERSHASFFMLYLPRQPVLVASVGAALLAFVLKHRVLRAIQVVVVLVVLFPVMGARLWFSPRPAAPDQAPVPALASGSQIWGR